MAAGERLDVVVQLEVNLSASLRTGMDILDLIAWPHPALFRLRCQVPPYCHETYREREGGHNLRANFLKRAMLLFI